MSKETRIKAACVLIAGLLFLFLFSRSDYKHLTSDPGQKDLTQINEDQGNKDQSENESTKNDCTQNDEKNSGKNAEGSKKDKEDTSKSDQPIDESKDEDKNENSKKEINERNEKDQGDEGKGQKNQVQKPDREQGSGSNDLFDKLPEVDGKLDPGTIPEPDKQEMNQKVTATLTQDELDAIVRTLESNEYTCNGKVCVNDSLFANTTSDKKNSITIDLDSMIMTGTYYFGTEPEVMHHRYDLKTGQGALVNTTRKLYCVSNKEKETMSCYDADSESVSPVLDDGLAAQYEQEIDRQLNRFY